MLVTERIDDAKQPYERLLGGAAVGDATLFAREDVVEAAWRVVNPVLGPTATLRGRHLGSDRGGPPARFVGVARSCRDRVRWDPRSR